MIIPVNLIAKPMYKLPIIKKLLTYLLTYALIGSFSITAYGQQVVKGTVKASDTGETLPGVNITIKGTTRGTVTNTNGNYELEVSPGDKVLVFSFLGYVDQEVEITNQPMVDVVLQLKSTELEEIVVVGYGTQRKSDLTGSVATVKAADITRIPTSSPMQALQGKVAGLQVVSSSGAPGSGVVVRVRGVGTFNNSNPIYVVDGVILNDIDFLNTSDIESMEVLKDASATAIYGSRGANGVIIVSTKRAKEGTGKTNYNISFESSIQQLQDRIDLLSGKEFATVVNVINPGTYNNIDAVPNTDWQDEIFKNGTNATIQNLQFSASGASDKMQYYLGVGYYNQKGIIPKSKYERISIKLNDNYSLSRKIHIGNNLTFTPYKQQNTNGNVVFIAYRAWPVLEPYQSDKSFTPLPGTGNPLADIKYTNSYNEGIKGTGNFFLDVTPLKGLTLKTSYGVDLSFARSKSFTPEFYVSPQQQNTTSSLYKGEETITTWIWENTVSYTRDFGKHHFDALAGFTLQDASSENIGMTGEDIIRDDRDFWYITSNNINPNSVYNGINADFYYSMVSYLFRLNYTFNSRYLFTATYRIDGSSKFTKDNRYAGFPSVAVGWNVHNEDFLKNNAVVTNLKVKASWGSIGNEKISYDKQYSLVSTGTNAVFGDGDIIVPGQTYSTAGNPDLKWETTYQTNFGVELGLWDNKLTAEFDYFYKTTKDILIALQLPGFIGYGSGSTVTRNAAEILNRGLEFNLRWNDNIGDFKYSVGVVGSTLHNEVKKVSGTGATDDYLLGGGGLTRSVVGKPVGAFYGYRVDGIFQNQTELDSYPHRSNAGVGDLRFVNTNGDNALTDADRTYLGSPIPTLTLGLNFTATYKNFDLNLDFQSQFGNKVFNVKETIRPDLYNFEDHVKNFWHGEGTSNSEPRPSSGGYNFLPSSRFIQDGSFIRLRNISIGYTLPEKVNEAINAGSIRIYISGTNVFTITDYTGYTPEILGGPVDNGLDYGTYPVSSIYSAGIRVTF